MTAKVFTLSLIAYACLLCGVPTACAGEIIPSLQHADAARPVPPSMVLAPPPRRKSLPMALGHKDTAERESGITFMEYITSSPHRPAAGSNTIYLLPLGTSLDTRTLTQAAQFLNAYFQLPVRAFQPIAMPEHAPKRRRVQHDADWLMHDVEKRLPERAYICLILTDSDIYTEGLPYVFGLAYADMRTCIVSTARITTHDDKPKGQRELTRIFKLAAHEIGHALGLPHCTGHSCLMNAQATLADLDKSDLALCPHCMKKQAWNICYDPAQRYGELVRIYTDLRMFAAANDASTQRDMHAEAHPTAPLFGR